MPRPQVLRSTIHAWRKCESAAFIDTDKQLFFRMNLEKRIKSRKGTRVSYSAFASGASVRLEVIPVPGRPSNGAAHETSQNGALNPLNETELPASRQGTLSLSSSLPRHESSDIGLQARVLVRLRLPYSTLEIFRHPFLQQANTQWQKPPQRWSKRPRCFTLVAVHDSILWPEGSIHYRSRRVVDFSKPERLCTVVQGFRQPHS